MIFWVIVEQPAVRPPIHPSPRGGPAWRDAWKPVPADRRRAATAIGLTALVVAAFGVYIISGDEDVVDLAFLPTFLIGLCLGLPAGVGAGGISATLLMTGWAFTYSGSEHGGLAAAALLLAGLCGGVGGRFAYSRTVRLGELAERLGDVYGRSLLLSAEALELRDVDTAGHSQRVALNALTLGRYAELDEDAQVDLYWAALLHDIGKIGVPEAVLNKPGRLNDSEWEVMKTHPTLGATLIEQTAAEFAEIARAVRDHHENWDGTGYPNQLRGEEISPLARLLSVVDVFDALTGPRPYRPALTHAAAVQHIIDRRGTQFEPAVVDCFLAAFFDGELAQQALPANWRTDALVRTP